MRLCVTLGLVIITVVSALTAESRSGPTSSLPNVVMFLTDTVRPDRVSSYGHRRHTTPVFDRLAEQGYLFTSAYAPSPWTRPSVASLFTGQYPQRHGVQMRQDKLPAAIPTLAQNLRKRGVQTVCVTTNPHVTETWGMTRGFDRIVEIMPNKHSLKAGNDARVVYSEFRDLAPELRPPFFLYVHLIDPHYPYEPPAPDLRALKIRAEEPNSRARYDAEVHHADRFIGRMMESLDETGFLEQSIVLMTADHGEEFGEHGSTGHGKTVYQEVVRVPLALKLPAEMNRHLAGVTEGVDATTGANCQTVRANVSLVDVMPTILSLMSLAVPGGIDGEDLTPLLRCEELEPRPLFFSVEKERASYAGVLLDNSKLIVDRVSGKRRLHILDDDPTEQGGGVGDTTELEPMAVHLASLLESFEWSARPGLHLELVGKGNQKDRRDESEDSRPRAKRPTPPQRRQVCHACPSNVGLVLAPITQARLG
ncbi:sulfatase, partial [Myxococcota bacterium]